MRPRRFREQHAAAFIKQHSQQEVKSNLFRKSDALILSAASISFLFPVSLWFGVSGAHLERAGEVLKSCDSSLIAKFGAYYVTQTICDSTYVRDDRG